MKDRHHTTLESGRSITQTKGHFSKCKCTKRASECRFLLVLGVYYYLIVPRITIQKTVVRMACQSLKHLVNEGQWKMILSSGRVWYEPHQLVMKPDTKYGTATKNKRCWNGTSTQCLAKHEPWYKEDATNGDGNPFDKSSWTPQGYLLDKFTSFFKNSRR